MLVLKRKHWAPSTGKNIDDLWRFWQCFPRPSKVGNRKIICIIWTNTMQFILSFVLWHEFTEAHLFLC